MTTLLRGLRRLRRLRDAATRASRGLRLALVHRLAAWCVWRGAAVWIHLRGGLYLERYRLVRAFGCDVFLHRFHMPDDDRGPHCHPWKWSRSVILVGGYVEQRPGTWLGIPDDRAPDKAPQGDWRHPRTAPTFRYYGPGQVNKISAGDFHRVAVLMTENDEVWTLFIAGPKHGKSWGYLIDGDFVLKRDEGGCDGCPYGAVRCLGSESDSDSNSP